VIRARAGDKPVRPAEPPGAVPPFRGATARPRRGPPGEAVRYGLIAADPLLLQRVNGGKPPRAVPNVHIPVMTAPSDPKAGYRADVNLPLSRSTGVSALSSGSLGTVSTRPPRERDSPGGRIIASPQVALVVAAIA